MKGRSEDRPLMSGLVVLRTAVALSIAAGAHPKEIQELCRHRSITTTLNEYGHLFPQLHERLAERLDAAARASTAGRMRDEDGTGVVTVLPIASENTL